VRSDRARRPERLASFPPTGVVPTGWRRCHSFFGLMPELACARTAHVAPNDWRRSQRLAPLPLFSSG
jgi:hypothetical protein